MRIIPALIGISGVFFLGVGAWSVVATRLPGYGATSLYGADWISENVPPYGSNYAADQGVTEPSPAIVQIIIGIVLILIYLFVF